MSRLELGSLSREAVGELAGSSCLDVDELFERTAGNPFFVTETLAAETDDVPETVSDAVHARVAASARPLARSWTPLPLCRNAPRCGCSRR